MREWLVPAWSVLGQRLSDVKASDIHQPRVLESGLNPVQPGLRSLCSAESYPPSSLSLLAASSRKPSWVLPSHPRLPSAQLTSCSQPCNYLFPGLSAHTSANSAPAYSRSLYLRGSTTKGLETGSQSAGFRSQLSH